MDQNQEETQQRKTEQERKLDTLPFIFRGEALALDLVNTEAMIRGKRRDLLTTPQDVEQWWQEVRQQHPTQEEVQAEEEGLAYDMALIDEIKRLRAALRSIFLAFIEGTTPQKAEVAVLNDILSTGYHHIEWTNEGKLYALYRVTDEKKETVLLPVALSALWLIREGDHKRLHQCDNERCILLFYDTTKSATRRWCSLGCLDRARSAQRYKAQKAKVQE